MTSSNKAPAHNGTTTSRAAARSIAGHTATLRTKIHAFMYERMSGATADEIEAGLKLSGNTVRPRLIELRRARRVVNGGYTRPTRAGRAATVWLAV